MIQIIRITKISELQVMAHRRLVGKNSSVYTIMTANEADMENFPAMARNTIAAVTDGAERHRK